MVDRGHTTRGAWPFTGRDGDLVFAHRLLTGASARGLVLCGPLGIGKTRLAAEIRAELERQGVPVFHVAASPAIRALPLGALLPLIEVPAAREDTMRGSLLQASRQLAQLADGEPFVLSVDDGQLLDESSTTVIHQLAATNGTPILMTVRTGEPVPAGVMALWKDGLAERIDIEPLDSAAIEHLIGGALDRPMDIGSRHVVSTVSGGNPLYLRELVLGSIESGTLREIGGQWRLGDGGLKPTTRLIELVVDRLAGVTPDERTVLDVIALGGREALPLVDELSPDGALVEALESRGLLRIDMSRRRRVIELAHPVHAEVLAAEMTARRRIQLVGDIATALERTGVRRREDLLRLAALQVESSAPVDPHLICEAAHQAALRHDEVLAEQLARAAWDAGGKVEAAVVLGGCMSRSGRMVEAAEMFASVQHIEAPERQRALLAIEHAETLFYGLGDLEAATRRIEVAHASIDDPTWRDQLIATGSAYKLMSGDATAALADVDRVINDGRTKAVVSGALIASPALVLVGRPLDAIDATTEGLEARADLDDPQGTTYDGMLLMARAFAQSESGQIAAAIETSTLGFDAALDDGVVLGQAWFGLTRGRALLLAGDLQAATAWFSTGRSCFDELGHAGLERWCQAGVMWAAAMTGDAARAEIEAQIFDSMVRNHILMLEPEMIRALAWNALVQGHPDQAAAGFQDAANLAATTGRITLEMGALHDLVRIGRTDLGADRLLSLTDLIQGDLAQVRRRHVRALLEDDSDGLEAVAGEFEALGSNLLAAEALAQAVPLLTKEKEGRRAARLSRRSRELAEPGGAATPALALAGAVAVLTDREREIAELAATGQPSKDIAERLYVSRRTVDNHLHRVYEKLGVGGRDELAEAIDAS